MHYPYDPAKAKALLDADGWKVGPDGIRVKNGQRLEFTLEHADRVNVGKGHRDRLCSASGATSASQADVKNYPTSEFFDNSGERHSAGRPLRRRAL